MRFVAEYRKLADEYRKLARKLARPKDKHALELMARAWDSAAAEREDRLIDRAVRKLLNRICQETVG